MSAQFQNRCGTECRASCSLKTGNGLREAAQPEIATWVHLLVVCAYHAHNTSAVLTLTKTRNTAVSHENVGAVVQEELGSPFQP